MLMDKSLIREFARSMEKLALNIDPTVLGALIGGGLGGVAGGTAGRYLTKDRRRRLRNMLLGGGAGVLGGALIGGALGSTFTRPAASAALQDELARQERLRRAKDLLFMIRSGQTPPSTHWPPPVWRPFLYYDRVS